MRNPTKKDPPAWTYFAVTLLMSGAAFADPTPADVTLANGAANTPTARAVPGVTVTGKTDPLTRSDRHLARLKKGLPGTTAVNPQSSGIDRSKSYLAAHRDPNSATGARRQMMKQAIEAPPEGVRNDGTPPLP